LYYKCRGAAEFNKGVTNAGMADFMKDISMAPHDSECMYNLSLVYLRLHDLSTADRYALMAQNAGFRLPSGYLDKLK
jgi:hypothetical protein